MGSKRKTDYKSIIITWQTILAYTRWNCLPTTDAGKSRSTPILTVRCLFQSVFCLVSVRSGWTNLLHDYKATTTTTGPDPPKSPTDAGRCTSEPRPCYKVPMSSMYSQRHKSRSELQVHQMLWNLKCIPVSEKKWFDLRHLLGPIVPAIATTNSIPCSAYRTDQWRQHVQRPTAQRLRNREQADRTRSIAGGK